MDGSFPQILAAVASGSLIGCALGLIGGGGSILATPLLIYVVGVRDVHTAIGTGALAVSANAYLNLVGHAIRGHVWWRCAFIFATAGSLGAYLGSSLGKVIDGQKLLFAFGLLMMFVSFVMRQKQSQTYMTAQSLTIGTHWKSSLVALLTGLCSGFFGIGGGFLIVPGLLLATGMPLINAIGTSLLAVGTFGLTTAINYAFSGFVDWLTAGYFIAGGIGGGIVGTVAATRLATHRNALSQIFRWVILCVSLYVLWRSHTEV
ncbi:sulfite exporter TauE/SafE family protein [Pararhizobium sp. YC-54]|uniref:sulfite exporter TauE/SafE family protein n=1 Tax=Pararhizobium sp. YC-54 TaxID=2986920 RepID=UPI0021F7DF3B|nr:sulfite exporter TauE/SafE family protein [Pararhizobium sp. YC-54]MCW0000570.1 sulfite exporter TauE/SafE family protein [Pararhizobium sp. YC-54]